MDEARLPDGAARDPHPVFVISDGTGLTGERVVQAAVTQFDAHAVEVRRFAKVRSPESITSAMEEADRLGATVLFSIVTPDHRRHLLEEARRLLVPTIDLLGPILHRLSDVLKTLPKAQAGIFTQLGQEYFHRIEAIDYAVTHDDGKRVDDLERADLVLVGISRSSKTPLSMYLAYRGWMVANVPIILDMEPPRELFALDPSKVVALAARPVWIQEIRQERARRMAPGLESSYAEMAYVRAELTWLQHIVARRGWTVIEVTHKAIEETAAEIAAWLRR